MKVSRILSIVSVVAAFTAFAPNANAEPLPDMPMTAPGQPIADVPDATLTVTEQCGTPACQDALNTIRNECQLTVKSGMVKLGCKKARLKELLAEFIASNAVSKACEGCKITVE